MKRLIITTGLMLGLTANAAAQVGQLINVRVADETVKKQGREVNVQFTLDLSDLRVGNQRSVELIPVIVADDGSREHALEKVIVDGRTRDRVHHREKKLTGAAVTDSAYQALRRHNGSEQRVEYTAVIPYEAWMAQSRLVLRERVTGCLACVEGNEEMPVKTPLLRLFTPHWATPYMAPESEPVKRREEVRVARVQFRQDSHRIDPEFKDNRRELDEVIASIDLVKENKDLTIKAISVKGYASPEGRMDYNRKLSERRANALAAYAQQHTRVAADLWQAEGLGEDWDELRRQVVAYPKLLKQQEVLDIIDRRGADLDAEERKLKALVPPEIYHRLLNEMYGPVRRNEYRIEYEVRNFSIEEAKAQLHVRPDLLSAAEMFAVAENYGPGTAEYGEALLIAAKTYPANGAAVANAACWYLSQDRAAEAIQAIEASQARTDARVLNALGVAYARLARYDEARTALQQAADAGSPDARTNLQQLQSVLNDL